jgi:diguanylate cyclase (GGDEF)-like protein
MEPSHAYPLLCASSVGVAFAAGVGAWRHSRTSAVGGPLAVVMFGLSWWSGLLLIQAELPDGRLREATTLLTLLGFSAAVAGFYCETRALVDGGWRLRWQTVILLSAPPVIMAAVALTNPLHHRLATFRYGAGAPWLPWQPGPLFWLHISYCYLVLAWCFQYLARALRSASSPLQRRQLRSILLTAALPTIGSLITLTRPSGEVAPDLTPTFIVLSGLVHYHAAFKQGLLRLLPVARGLVLEHVGDAIFVMDPAGLVVDLNPAARLLARRLHPDLPNDLLGMPARRLLPHRDQRRTLTAGEYHIERPDGWLDLDLRLSDLADRHGYPVGRVVVIRDITELNEQRRRLADVNHRLMDQLHVIDALRHDLAELAVRDELTGLHNRRHLIGRLERDLDAARSDARPLSLILLDIDRFKSVNDRYGHAVGDALLVATARALRSCVRAGDTLARYGGEEFVVLLPDASMDEALHMAEVLRTRCATVRVDSRFGPVSTTVSAGVSTFPDCGWTGAELLQSADDALYAAKHAGRDRVVCAPML